MTSATYPRVMLAIAAVVTAMAFVFTYGAGVGPIWGAAATIGVVVACAALAIIAVATARFLLLPQLLAQGPDRRGAAIVVASTYAYTPSVFGLIAAVYTGQGLIALPFAALSLLSFFVLLSPLKRGLERP